jgi:hypothetical protein
VQEEKIEQQQKQFKTQLETIQTEFTEIENEYKTTINKLQQSIKKFEEEHEEKDKKIKELTLMTDRIEAVIVENDLLRKAEAEAEKIEAEKIEKAEKVIVELKEALNEEKLKNAKLKGRLEVFETYNEHKKQKKEID